MLFKTPQRFQRETFICILKAEIWARSKFLEESLMGDTKRWGSPRRPEVDSGKLIPMKGPMTSTKVSLILREDWPSRVYRSKMSYIARKRDQQRAVVAAGADLVGKRVVIYEEVSDIWRLNIVLDCSLSWIDDGTVACVTHTIQVRCQL